MIIWESLLNKKWIIFLNTILFSIDQKLLSINQLSFLTLNIMMLEILNFFKKIIFIFESNIP